MNRRSFLTGLLLLLLLPGAISAQNAIPPQKPAPRGKPAPTLQSDKLAWLAGHWRMERAGRLVEEEWLAPAGGVMLGMGRTVAKGKVVEFGFMQIREGPGGELFFVALPSGQKESAFRILSFSEHAVVFENKEHDFPQTVGYELKADGALLAYVEGSAADGTTKRIEFPYQRIQP